MASTRRAPAKTKGRAPHRRDERARVAVLHAADDLLVERGFGGVTVEGIAARAGVAKQTIYRWWSSKVEILLDTLVDDGEEQLPVPDSGPVVESVRRYMRGMARFLDSDPAGRVLLALIGEAQHDADVARMLNQRFLEPRRERERLLLERGVASGELPSGLDAEAALDALCGPIFYRALGGRRSTRAFVDQVVDDILKKPRAA